MSSRKLVRGRSEVVRERTDLALLAVAQELVDEVEDVGCLGVAARMHRGGL